MSDDIFEELVNEMYKEEFEMVDGAISKLQFKQEEFEKESEKLEELHKKVKQAKEELEEEQEKISTHVGTAKKEIDEVSNERIMAEIIVNDCEKQYRQLLKRIKEIKENQEFLTQELEIIEHKLERARNIRLTNGIKELSKIKNLNPEAREIIRSLTD